MSDELTRLSLRLCEVLERVGISDSMRKIYRDSAVLTEIESTLAFKMTDTIGSIYTFGSSCEGTTTPGMKYDLDNVLCLENMRVIQDIREAPAGRSYLMVTDEHTKPGPVKLQAVQDGIPLTMLNYNWSIGMKGLGIDQEGRICLKHITSTSKIIIERSGPAQTASSGSPFSIPTDCIFALRHRMFPLTAQKSLNKCIPCGWMSEEEVDDLKKLGILLVGKGHPDSDENNIEWTISFSFQERQLLLALNPVQHKCCVMLKLLKEMILEVLAVKKCRADLDVKKCISTYHCKTCLFHVITNTDRELWIEENLIQCVFKCLAKLIDWVSRGYCPNFFVEQSNMFERLEFKEMKEQILSVLKGMERLGPSLFYTIQSDDIGEALKGQAIVTENRTEPRRWKELYKLLIDLYGNFCFWQNGILLHCDKLQSRNEITLYLDQQLCYLASVETITEHTQEQTQTVTRWLLPIMHRLYAQQLASVAFSTEDSASRHRLLEDSDHHLSQGKKGERLLGSLLEATILYRGGHLQSCRDLLGQIERSIMYGAVVSTCTCNFHHGQCVLNFALLLQIATGNTKLDSLIDIMERAVASCMMFLRSQSEIIPKALQYEMYRSVGASPETRYEALDEWYDLAVVDSKIYLFFMQYLVYRDLNQMDAKRKAIDQIWGTLIDLRDNLLGASNLGHRETAYNLLGWIYIQEGQIPEAIMCFRSSWRIKPDHNAARWHLPGLWQRMLELHQH